jgi:hypothetical protein
LPGLRGGAGAVDAGGAGLKVMIMRYMLIVLAIVSGYDEPKRPAEDPGTQRGINPESVVGTYDLSLGIESVGKISIVKKDDNYEHTYAFSTDDGGTFVATGPVRFVGDRIDLVMKKIEQNRDFTVDGKRSFAEVGVRSYFLIKWDKKVYLVPEEDLVQFCNKVNLKSKPEVSWTERYYIRDRSVDADGVMSTAPELPLEAKGWILSDPIHGTILSVEDGRAKIDLGAEEQVWKNMLLYCEPDELAKAELLKKGEKGYQDQCVLLKVVAVHKGYCLAEIDEHQRHADIGNIRKGYWVSSRFPKSLSKEIIWRNYFRN